MYFYTIESIGEDRGKGTRECPQTELFYERINWESTMDEESPGSDCMTLVRLSSRLRSLEGKSYPSRGNYRLPLLVS